MLSSENIKKIFGQNLCYMRKSLKMTQEQLAEIVSMDYKTISGIETGKAFVSSEAMSKFCNYFNVEPSYFFKAKFSNVTPKEQELKKEIDRLLSDCDDEKLQMIYNVIAALKK